MKHFVIVLLAILVIIPISIAGCGGDNMDNLWVDIQGDGYPEVNDDKFVPIFIKKNKKSLDKLADLVLSYNFDCFIDLNKEEVCVIIWEENLSQDEDGILRIKIQSDEKLMLHLSTLLELEYIESLDWGNADGKSVFIRFSDMDGQFGPIARSARYIPKDVLKDHPRKWEYLGQFHVKGNWFYMTEGRI